MHVPRGCMTAVMVVVLSVALPTHVEANPLDIGSILGGVAGSLIKEAFQSREIELLGHYCLMERTAYIKSLEVHYRAEVSCQGWTTAKGKGSGHRNATNSENDAIRDFMTKVVNQGLITREEASPWLDN